MFLITFFVQSYSNVKLGVDKKIDFAKGWRWHGKDVLPAGLPNCLCKQERGLNKNWSIFLEIKANKIAPDNCIKTSRYKIKKKVIFNKTQQNSYLSYLNVILVHKNITEIDKL